MDAVLLGAVLTPLVPFILDVVRQKHELKRGIEGSIRSIQRELPMIAAAIEQHQSARVVSEQVRRELIERFREFAHEIELRIGLFAHAHARKRQRSWPLRGLNLGVSSRTQFARRLEELQKSLVKAEELAEKNKVTDTPVASSQEPQEPGDRAKVKIEGMNDRLDRLIELLSPSLEQSEDMGKVISIVGPGGVGKTLLARRLVSALDLDFSPKAFVHAACNTEKDVLRRILEEIGVKNVTATFEKDELCKLLRENLKTKRYLIVIDDMRDQQKWKAIEAAFPNEPHVSSRVICTTTIQSVADACASPSGHVYRMEALNAGDSERLFIREVNLDEHRDALICGQSELLRKCDGLPLALVSIAEILHERGLAFCPQACSELGSLLEDHQALQRMQWVLAHKYTGLDCYALKARLLYFCTFDSANPIRRNHIIRRWLAEGFVEPIPRRNCNLMSVEHNNLETLIDRNIITTADVSNNGKVRRCKPSGMVLEYITYKSMVEKLIAFPDQEPPPRYTRWLPFHDSRGGFSNVGDYYPRTLAASRPAGESVVNLANSQLMRVLDLEQCSDLQRSHVTKICDRLLLLRYLSLGASITEVPRKIANLVFLETVDLKKTNVMEVPLEVILLPNLRYLLGRFQLFRGDYCRSSKSKVEKFLSEKSKLETLAGFVTRKNQGFPQLMHHMMRLRKVKIWLKLDADSRNLNDLVEAIRKFIFECTGMPGPGDRSLSIDFKECPQSFLDSLESEKFLASLPNACGSLATLKVHGPGLQLRRIIGFVTKVRGITELCISSTTLSWDATVQDCLSKLTVLRYLKLVADEGMEPTTITIQPEHFKALKRMCLVVEQNLLNITIQAGALKHLESLHLICRDLDSVSAAQIQQLRSLKEVALHSGVTEATKTTWKNAARSHLKRPNVLFIEYPRPV